MSDTTSNCAWVCSRCGAFVFSGTGHLCPSQRASTELMSDVQKEILENLRTIRDQTRQIAELETERGRLLQRAEKAEDLNKFFRDSVGECHVMISRNTAEYQIREEWDPCDLPPRLQKVMRAALAASEPKEPK